MSNRKLKSHKYVKEGKDYEPKKGFFPSCFFRDAEFSKNVDLGPLDSGAIPIVR